MSIFITGDPHDENEIKRLSNNSCEYSNNLSTEDSIIILGDFGLIFNNIETNTEKYWLNWLENKRFNIYFIDGNHDNHSKIWEYPMYGKFRKIRTNIFYIPRGTIFELENITFLGIGGAGSHDKPERKEGIDWWRTELLTKKEEDNILKVIDDINKVDIVLTHTAPISIIDKMLELKLLKNYSRYSSGGYNCPNNNIYYYPVSKFLEEVKSILKFKEWYFGYLHIDEIIELDDSKYIATYKEIRKLNKGE